MLPCFCSSALFHRIEVSLRARRSKKQKFSFLLRFVFFCYTSLKFHSTAVTYYMYAPLYRKISPRLLIVNSRCEHGEASKKYCILGFKITKQNKNFLSWWLKFICFIFSRKFLRFCLQLRACEAKHLKSSQDTLP